MSNFYIFFVCRDNVQFISTSVICILSDLVKSLTEVKNSFLLLVSGEDRSSSRATIRCHSVIKGETIICKISVLCLCEVLFFNVLLFHTKSVQYKIDISFFVASYIAPYNNYFRTWFSITTLIRTRHYHGMPLPLFYYTIFTNRCNFQCHLINK